MLKTKLVFCKKMPDRTKFPDSSVLFFDSILLKKPFFKKWSQNFKCKIALKSGENLKSIDQFKKFAELLGRKNIPQTQDLTFIAVGGGSVGDFVGFLSSVYLRGRPFIQIPSTWLAAVDSAHGGKNGLNLNGKKNQIGTFYWPNSTYLIEELLNSQPQERWKDALGEVVKISLISSKKTFHTVTKNRNFDLFSILPKLIQMKSDIVEKDPLEKEGHRRLLNLGHTLGHVFEVNGKWSHGISVWAGIIFSLRYSYQKGLISDQDFIEIWNGLHQLGIRNNYQKLLQKLSLQQVVNGLIKDKKITKKNEIDFIFIHGLEKIKRQKVSLQDLIAEFKRQRVEI